MDFDDYNDYEEEHVQEFRVERNAFERAGIRNDIDVEIEDIEKKSRTKKTPLERFVESVNAIIPNTFANQATPPIEPDVSSAVHPSNKTNIPKSDVAPKGFGL